MSSIVVLQPRDISLLRLLFESRILTRKHASILCFDGSAEAAKKRIQKLKNSGYLIERRPVALSGGILSLTRKGISALEDAGVLSDYESIGSLALNRRTGASDLTLQHELAVLDVKCAFHSATQHSKTLAVTRFITWPRLIEFGEGAGLVKPDGFCTITDGKTEHRFFIEVDRSTESLDRLVSRARAYHSFYRSGEFAKRSGLLPSAYRYASFRLLFVLKSAARRANIARRLLELKPAIATFAWLATQDHITRDPFGAIWIRPADLAIVSLPPKSVAGFRRLLSFPGEHGQ